MSVKLSSIEKDEGKVGRCQRHRAEEAFAEMEKATANTEGTCKALGICAQATMSLAEDIRRQRLGLACYIRFRLVLHCLQQYFSRIKPVREAVVAVFLSY